MAISSAVRQFSTVFVRSYANTTMKTMQAWQALQYGNPDILQLNSTSIPVLSRPDEVLVKVHAASVNPLDVMMLNGYGATMISMLRFAFNSTSNSKVFPLVLGRDFSGEIVSAGKFARGFRVGDEVFGVVGPQESGSHAEFVKTSAFSIAKKPMSISHVEAASVPYAGLTAWSAISTFGGLSKNSAYGKKVLVIGASGGVGTLAVQLFKAWGADVTAVCSTDAVEMVQNSLADHVIDYLVSDVKSELKQMHKFDFILDTVGCKNLSVYLDALKPWKNSKYVTVVSPLLQNADQQGLILGTSKSFLEASCDSLMGLRKGRSVRWAYFIPNGYALCTIGQLIENRQINPVVNKVYSFEDAIDAYKKVVEGHARGKIVIDMFGKPECVETKQDSEADHTETEIQNKP